MALLVGGGLGWGIDRASTIGRIYAPRGLMVLMVVLGAATGMSNVMSRRSGIGGRGLAERQDAWRNSFDGNEPDGAVRH